MKGKIVLFSPKPAKSYFYQGLPLSILAISSFLHKDGYEIKIVKASPDANYKKEVLDEVKDAFLLGVTVITGNPIKEAIEVSQEAKRINPSIKVVWGGWHPSILPDEVITQPFVDAICIGQGERSFYEMAKMLETNKSLEGIQGTMYKIDGKIYRNPERVFENVNNFPNLPYEILNLEDYIMKTELGSRTINLITSQGCPHRCEFCVEPLVYKRRWYGLEAKKVVDDIELFYKKYNIDSVFFNDSNFFVSEDRVKTICEELLKRNIKIKWGMANARAPQLLNYKEDTWKLLIDTGLKSVLIGAESGSQESLELIKKDMKVDDLVKLAEKCLNSDIRIYYSFMTGLPPNDPNLDENGKKKVIEKDLKATLNVIDQIFSINRRHSIYLFLYTPYPKTPLFDLSLKNGLKKPESLEEWSNFELVVKSTPWVDENFANKVNYLHNFIFPFICGVYYDKVKSRYKGIKGVVFKLLARLIELDALLRWKTKFFSFTLDHKIVRLFLKMRSGSEEE